MTPYADPDAQRAYGRDWMRRRRETWISENGPCSCGSWEDLEVVSKKGAKPKGIWSRSKAQFEKQIAGCEIVCRGCRSKRPKCVGCGEPVDYGSTRCRPCYNDWRTRKRSAVCACGGKMREGDEKCRACEVVALAKAGKLMPPDTSTTAPSPDSPESPESGPPPPSPPSPDPPKHRSSRTCVDCGKPVGARSQRCRDCFLGRARDEKRGVKPSAPVEPKRGACSMCGKPATTSYGAPVCQSCYDGLVELDVELQADEDADPVLARLGAQTEFSQIVREAQRRAWRDRRRRERGYGRYRG